VKLLVNLGYRDYKYPLPMSEKGIIFLAHAPIHHKFFSLYLFLGPPTDLIVGEMFPESQPRVTLFAGSVFEKRIFRRPSCAVM